MHALTAGLILNAASGVLMIALGVFVLVVRGRTQQNRAFALFAIPFGAAWVVDNLWRSAGHTSWWPGASAGLLLVLASMGLVFLAAVYPRRLERRDAWIILVAIIVGLERMLVHNGPQGLFVGIPGSLLPASTAGLFFTGQSVREIATWTVLALFALTRLTRWRDDPDDRAGLGLMSAALVLFPAFGVGRVAAAIAAQGLAPAWAIALDAFFLVALFAAVWAWIGKQTGRGLREALVGWAAIVACLAGVADLGAAGLDHPGYGISRTAGVAILAYAIVRRQLLGIELRVRWTLSKSATASIFVAVFFVASEGAQLLFGSRAGGPVVGILAAGALVFAFAPLSRLADRLAARAVPLAKGTDTDGGSKEAVYRAAVRLALRGGITRAEEMELAGIAEANGISATRALALRHEVEDGVRPAVQPRATGSKLPSRGRA